MNDIISLEDEMDLALTDVRLSGRPRPELTARAIAWSSAVWNAAREAPLDESEVQRSLHLARRPVFVCGVHRSGTTLVRDLLDGHPALSVLPSEGTFFTSLKARIDAAGSEGCAATGREWIRRLANPINQPPFWLLGRTSAAGSRYVQFGSRLLAWWKTLERVMAPGVSQWPLVAAALAYHDVSAPDPRTVLRWVEKTPTNERFADRLYADFPDAKIIHVLRGPENVFASRKRLEERSAGGFTTIRRTLADLAFSYASAVDRAASEGPRRYLVVRYEDLLSDPDAITRRMAAFLEIEWLPVLLQPTVAGKPAGPNSSFVRGSPGEIARGDPREPRLATWERDLLTACVGDLARRAGYDDGRSRSWRAQLLKPAAKALCAPWRLR